LSEHHDVSVYLLLNYFILHHDLCEHASDWKFILFLIDVWWSQWILD